MDQQIRVLVVDDDEPHAEAVAESLERVGYECVVATSGREGLRLIEEQTFDIIITDLIMDGVGGLEILAKAKRELTLPVLTDVHSEEQIAQVSCVVDVLQTPAFLCRQTDFIRAVAQSGKPVNIKKGQFLAPGDMKNVIDKARAAAREKGLLEDNFMACERGVSFGYNNLVSDMRSLAIMRDTQAPVVFDATHSVQLPGGQGTSSGGQREMVPVLARAAVAVGVAGLFMETHPNPAKAMSDGPNAVPLHHMKALLETLVELDHVTKKNSFLENDFT